MPRIDFYLLQETSEKFRFQFACRLIEKAYKQKHRIYIHTENQQDAFTIDELLWTYREDSFLPHNLYGEGPEPLPPIQIGFNVSPENQRDILINLSRIVPVFFKQFARILELVTADPTIQATAREHFRFYRKENLEINTHKLQAIEV